MKCKFIEVTRTGGGLNPDDRAIEGEPKGAR